MMKKHPVRYSTMLVLIGLIMLSVVLPLAAQERREILIPDLPGYHTLKCDFHMHTVFSDGNVWPTVRVEEAWREGLDAISITDHLEYQPHKKDVVTDRNRAYELAQGRARELGVMLIHGTEITRSMPPGHFNAIFIKDAEKINKEDFLEAVGEAEAQGGLVIWNHPGWTGQQPDGVARWYPIHTTLLQKGWMQGMEVVNYWEYYPEVQQWCLDKGVTMLGNSDIHQPISLVFHVDRGEHRPMTLVFAKERSPESIREALLAGRTLVYFKNLLIGEKEFLEPIFQQSLIFKNGPVSLEGKKSALLQICNQSEVPFYLISADESGEVTAPKEITLPPQRTVLVRISGRNGDVSGIRKISLPYIVKNLYAGSKKGLVTNLEFTVRFIAPEKNGD